MKRGDKVIFRSNTPRILWGVDINYFCGTTITVSYFIYDNVFRIEEDNGRYMWSTDMITPLGDLYEAIQSRRHCPDSTME